MEGLRRISSSYSSYKMYIFVTEYLNYISVEKGKILEENIWVLAFKIIQINCFDLF